MTVATWIFIGTVIAAFLIFKQVNAVKPETAREWLKKGATVIDVRSEAEFQERHLPGTINIPLDRLRDEIARVAPNKEQPLSAALPERDTKRRGGSHAEEDGLSQCIQPRLVRAGRENPLRIGRIAKRAGGPIMEPC